MILVDKDKLSQHVIGLRLLRKSGANPLSYDIHRNVTVASVSQALSMKSMFLKMIFQDGNGLLESGTITIGDTVEFTLYRDEDDETKIIQEFRIVDISGVKQTENTKMTQYAIHAVSNPAYINRATRISRSTNGQVSAIAFRLLSEDLKIPFRKIDIEPTKNATSIIFNKTSPFDALSQLEERAISYNGSVKDNLYFLFETPSGFTFSSARKLVNKGYKFIYNQYPSATPTDDQDDYYRIQHFEQSNFSNAKDLTEKGVLENEVVLFDVLNRKIDSYDFVFEEDKKDILLLGKHAFSDYKTISNEISQYTKTNSSFDKKTNVSIFPSEESFERIEWKDKKHSAAKAQLELLRQNKISLKIQGNHEVMAGDVMRLIVPSKFMTNEEVPQEDRLYTGDYLVAAVRHDIAVGANFFTIVDLYKDALELKVENL
jgi:hypothetical protein